MNGAAGTHVTGEGHIDGIQINAEDVVVDLDVDEVTLGEGIGSAEVGGEEYTGTEEEPIIYGGGGGGGGGGSAAPSDTIAPTVESFSIDGSEVTSGETIIFDSSMTNK